MAGLLAAGRHGDPVTANAEKIAELLGTAPISSLAPIERRLVDIASQFWMNIVIQLRVDSATQTMRDLNDDLVAKSARFALIAAIETDEQLRKLRDGLKAAQKG